MSVEKSGCQYRVKSLHLAAYMKANGAEFLSCDYSGFLLQTEVSIDVWRMKHSNSCCRKVDLQLLDLREALKHNRGAVSIKEVVKPENESYVVEELHLAAYMKANGATLLDCVGRGFEFKSDVPLSEWCVKHANSCCRKVDLQLLDLKEFISKK